MTNMPLEGASWSLRFSKHNNLQLEICCKIMRVLPLIITHDFHGHAQEDHSGVVAQMRRQMSLGTYLLHEKSILGWFGQPGQ